MKSRFFLTFLFALNLGGCQRFWYNQQLRLWFKNTVPVMQPNRLAALLKEPNPVYLLDTRSPREFEISHLAGARLVDYNTFSLSDISTIPKEATVVVYCAVGVRSERVGERLLKAGYKQVYNLYGGIFTWKNSGYPVVNKAGEPTNLVHTYNRYWAVWLHKGIKIYE